MASPGKKISCVHACLILTLSVGLLLLLSSRLDVMKEKYSVMKDFMEKYIKKPKEPLLESLLVELEESLEQIAKHSHIPKVRESDDMKCNLHFKDKELEKNGCPPGIRTDCIQENMSKDLRHRLEDLMYNKNLQIAPQYREILLDLEKQVEGYYHLVIVHALSSNHYLESQAMLKNLHENIFPVVPNMKLVVYDIGLTPKEHEEYKKFCRCKLIKFPFEKFPSFCRTLKCFCWKPFILRAHLGNGDMVMWVDASVRYYKRPERFFQALKRTEMYGIQQNHVITQPKIPSRAMPATFHHLGFSPCAFKDYHSAASNWAVYRNSPLIKHAILDTWTACGLNVSCTCPKLYGLCPPPSEKYSHVVGQCQRPQTALAAIIARVWMEDYSSVAAIQDSFDLWRGHLINYFERLQRNENRTAAPKVASFD